MKKPQGADRIEEVIAAMRKGRMVIMTDDAQRENEGDLVLAARSVTPDTDQLYGSGGSGFDLCSGFPSPSGEDGAKSDGAKK